MEYHDGRSLDHMGDLPTMGAHRYGDKAAFAFHGREQSYAEFEAAANRIANVLTFNGVKPGDRVGLFIPNTLQFPAAYFGTIKAGAIAVPLNLRMDPETLVFVMNDSGTEQLIGSPLLADEVRDLATAAEIDTVYLPGVSDDGIVNLSHATMDAPDTFEQPARSPDDVATQPYTSGTTGQPKGVPLTHRNLLSTIESLDRSGLALDPDDAILLVLPLFHIYGLNGIMGTYLYRGASMVFEVGFEPEPVLEAIEDHGITKFAGVPAMFTAMFRVYRANPAAYDLSSLDDVVCGAAPLAEDTRDRIEKTWDVPVIEAWGMTETAPAGAVTPARGVRKAAGCVGPAVPNIEIKLTDPRTRDTIVPPDAIGPGGLDESEIVGDDPTDVTGEIAVRGEMAFDGYYNRPEKTAEVFDDDGWFYTADIARVDSDGYFWIVDRADDMIITGGENIYPAEVEDALYAHPDVAEAAVVAAPHAVKGEAPVAFVVLEAGADITERALREFTLDHVASYAHPRRIFFVEELPRSATQKVQRFKLEAEVTDRLDGSLESSEEL